MSNRKKQSTRMLKCECGDCGAIFRMSAKVLAMAEDGLSCPVCREENVQVG
jgi:Zn finger protein HypA/HybF involved in hydrogenase expression